MQVTATESEGLKRRCTITVTAGELEAKVQEKITEARPGIEIKGFRKGKVPVAILRRQFGPRLLSDAMQEAIDGAMRAHFEATGDRPAVQPEVRMERPEWKEGEDVVVLMSYEALPAVPEIGFADIALERLVVATAPEAVDEALGRLATSAGSFEDRPEGEPAAMGDQVVIDYEGKVAGEPFKGGSGSDHPLVLGSGSFIPGFEGQLDGARAGEARTLSVTFPADYGARELAGQTAEFAVTVKAVRLRRPAAIDDALAKRLGAETLAALTQQVGERMTAEYRAAARSVMKRALLDALDVRVSFELPPSLVAAEARQVAHQLWHEEHPEVHGHDHGDVTPTDEHVKLAERRVRLGLLLAEVGRKAEVTVTEGEMTQAVMAQVRQYPGQERAFFEFVQKNAGAQQQIRAPIFEDKVVDHIFGLAAVTERAATREELQQAVAALDVV
ncbi:MAG: trigger factor [Rhodobacteraceae bacterium]|nr:trigger factor [Paracoccaceae bacterium]